TVNEVVYVVKEDGVCRIATTTRTLAELGTEALRRLDAGDTAGARQWLDWARGEGRAGGGDDPPAGWSFTRFWTKGKEEPADVMRIAAAALVADGSDTPEKALPILLAARESAKSDERRADLDLALMSAYLHTQKWEDVLAAAR